MRKQDDITGMRFGKLTVLRFIQKNKRNGLLQWECRCDCGNIIDAFGAHMKSGLVRSCGCHVENEEEKPLKIKIGQKVRFDPFRDITGFASDMNRGRDVRGTVVYINEPHKWFSVEYGKPKARISFNFFDIGHGVQLLK